MNSQVQVQLHDFVIFVLHQYTKLELSLVHFFSFLSCDFVIVYLVCLSFSFIYLRVVILTSVLLCGVGFDI